MESKALSGDQPKDSLPSAKTALGGGGESLFFPLHPALAEAALWGNHELGKGALLLI